MKKITTIIILASLFVFACGKKQIYRNESSLTNSQKLTARDHYTAGMFYQLRNKHESALIEFYQALLYDSTSSTIYNRIAENHIALGRYESALRYLQKSKKLNSKDIETYRLMSDCYYRLKNDEKAIEFLIKVLVMDPFDENSRSLLLLLYRKTNDQLGMAKQYQELIEIYGEDKEWVRKAAEIYLKKGQLDEALSIFETSLLSDSTNAAMWYSMGTVYEMKKDEEQAVTAYLEALKYEPRAHHAGERIYRIYARENKWEKLIEIFEPYQQKYSTVKFYTLVMADAFIHKEEFDNAESILLPLLDEEDVPWRTYELLGRIELEKDNFSQAAEYFQIIIDIDSKNRLGWIYKGIALADTDSVSIIENHYRKALQYLPEDPDILSFHGISLNRMGRTEEALVPLEKAIKLDPHNLNALISYGLSLNQLNRDLDAIAPLKVALKVDSTNITALSTLGMLYDNMKMYSKCDSIYTQSLQIYPENDLILNNYAYTLAERSYRLDFALEMAKKAIKIRPDNGAYLDTIGWIYYKLSKFNLALEYIKRSLEQRENSPVVIEHLGDVYLKLGDKKQAMHYWKRSLEMDDSNIELKRKVEKLSL
jgi:tetratricopeptide (TPR) repeat protein